jgi:hypothetical protein
VRVNDANAMARIDVLKNHRHQGVISRARGNRPHGCRIRTSSVAAPARTPAWMFLPRPDLSLCLRGSALVRSSRAIPSTEADGNGPRAKFRRQEKARSVRGAQEHVGEHVRSRRPWGMSSLAPLVAAEIALKV